MSRIVDMDFHDRHLYLIFTAQHLLKNYLIKTLKEEGIRITPAHTTILFLLEEDSPQTMTDLSQALHIDNSTVTGLIDRLEKSGFVRRTDHTSDRRKWSVSISSDGLGEIARARTVIRRINKEIESGFSKEDLAVLHRILGSYIEKFA
jgi:DNA-binding MarR family transcriptional regulator